MYFCNYIIQWSRLCSWHEVIWLFIFSSFLMTLDPWLSTRLVHDLYFKSMEGHCVHDKLLRKSSVTYFHLHQKSIGLLIFDIMCEWFPLEFDLCKYDLWFVHGIISLLRPTSFFRLRFEVGATACGYYYLVLLLLIIYGPMGLLCCIYSDFSN